MLNNISAPGRMDVAFTGSSSWYGRPRRDNPCLHGLYEPTAKHSGLGTPMNRVTGRYPPMGPAKESVDWSKLIGSEL